MPIGKRKWGIGTSSANCMVAGLIGDLSFVIFRCGIAFDGIDNKDASVFPVPIPDPFGFRLWP